MQGSLDEPPVVIWGQRWSWRRAFPTAIIALAFLSQLGASGGDFGRFSQAPMGWMLGSLLVLVAVNLTWQACSPPRLELSPRGVRMTITWRTWRYGWNEIGNFRLVSLPRAEAVGFDYTDPAKARSGYRQWVRTSYGASGFLASNMEVSAAELVGLLNRARERWASAAAAPAVASGQDLVPTMLGRMMALLVGRTGRRAYWIGVGVVALIAGVLAIAPGARIAALTWAFIGWMTLSSGRLRDLGRSPLWLNVMWPPVSVALLAPIWAGMGFDIGLGLAVLVWLAVVAALGAIPGDAERNRFGMPPGAADESETIGSAFT